eukprot:UN04975
MSGNQLLQEGAAVNDDYTVPLTHAEGPDENDIDDALVMDFMATPMGNEILIDEIENEYNEDEDMDILNDVNATGTTKGNEDEDDYDDIILEKDEFLISEDIDNVQNIEMEGDTEDDDDDDFMIEEMNTIQ